MPPTIRPGQPGDVAAMVALRAQLFTDLAAQGSATRPDQATESSWQEDCAATITAQLTHPDIGWMMPSARLEQQLQGFVQALAAEAQRRSA